VVSDLDVYGDTHADTDGNSHTDAYVDWRTHADADVDCNLWRHTVLAAAGQKTVAVIIAQPPQQDCVAK